MQSNNKMQYEKEDKLQQTVGMLVIKDCELELHKTLSALIMPVLCRAFLY